MSPTSTVRHRMLCTLGPSSLNERVIGQLEEAGAALFRINMSHTELDDLPRILRFVRKSSGVPISIDTEGARLRTGRMTDRVTVFEGGRVQLVPDALWGDAYTIPISPGGAIQEFEPGARVSIDFDAVILRVDSVEDGTAQATVLSGGDVGTRKAVTALPSPQLPPFSEKDRLAIQLALEHGVREFALSFSEGPDSVTQLRQWVGKESTIVSKIESREGVRRLSEILGVTDRILIDRGDLSREVRIEGIPLLQKAIVRAANAKRVPAYVATNFLESMVTRRVPTRAEVNDVVNTLIDGADGLILSAETAVGMYPVESARMMSLLIREYESAPGGDAPVELLGAHPLEEPLSAEEFRHREFLRRGQTAI